MPTPVFETLIDMVSAAAKSKSVGRLEGDGFTALAASG